MKGQERKNLIIYKKVCMYCKETFRPTSKWGRICEPCKIHTEEKRRKTKLKNLEIKETLLDEQWNKYNE